MPSPPNEKYLNIEELNLLSPLLNKEEPVLDLELEQEDEEGYQVEEPSHEETQTMFCGISIVMRTMTKGITVQKSTLMKSMGEVKEHS